MRKMNGPGDKKKNGTKKNGTKKNGTKKSGTKKVGEKKVGGAKVSVKANNKSTVNRRTPADYKRYRKEMEALKDRGDRRGKHIPSNANVGTGKPGAISKVKSGYKYKRRKNKSIYKAKK